MEIFLMVLGILFLAILGIISFAITRPDTFRIQRNADLNSGPESIFPHIHDFHHWAAWSPWEKLDPEMKKAYSGNPKGLGAVYEWDGNNKVGKGRMEIIEEKPPTMVTIKLNFFRPFVAENISEFALEKQGPLTRVTWAMFGKNTFMGKVMGLVMNMDNLIGKDFEKGLAQLKMVVEKK